MEPLRIGFLGAGGFARHTIYPALHLAPQSHCKPFAMPMKIVQRTLLANSVQVDITPIGTKCLKKKTWKQSSSRWVPTQGNRLCLKRLRRGITSSHQNRRHPHLKKRSP